MHAILKRPGGLTFFVLASTVLGGGRNVAPVQSRVFDVDYVLNEDALPVETVQIWYTADEGKTWLHYGYDEDRQSPATFQAPSEGLFGIYFRATNAAGTSGEPPTVGVEPHIWAFVDTTPPVIQLHEARPSIMLGRRAVQLRWTAIDAHLTSRPIEFEYRSVPGGQWQPAFNDPFPNTGRYDWRVPEEISGPIEVRLIVRDRGGFRVGSEPIEVDLTARAAATPRPDANHSTRNNTPSRKPRQPSAATAKSGETRAMELYLEALGLREQGDLRHGISRLRDAVKLNPFFSDGFAELGSILYQLGDLDRALTAYEIALGQQPTMRRALRGSAKVFRQKKDFASAAKQLRAILRTNPNDAEAWMNLGDIGIFQGDELLARECYVRATQIDAGAEDVIRKAKERLALMAEVSRTYQQRN